MAFKRPFSLFGDDENAIENAAREDAWRIVQAEREAEAADDTPPGYNKILWKASKEVAEKKRKEKRAATDEWLKTYFEQRQAEEQAQEPDIPVASLNAPTDGMNANTQSMAQNSGIQTQPGRLIKDGRVLVSAGASNALFSSGVAEVVGSEADQKAHLADTYNNVNQKDASLASLPEVASTLEPNTTSLGEGGGGGTRWDDTLEPTIVGRDSALGKENELLWMKNAMESNILKDAIQNLAWYTKLKRLPLSTEQVLKYISENNRNILRSASNFGIPEELIQTVIFREAICLGMDDILSDITYLSFKRINSTGIGQINPYTAIKAEENIFGNSQHTIDSMWQSLQNEENNIYYIGMVLKMEANKLGIDTNNLDRNGAFRLLNAYNGDISYAEESIQYYDAFLEAGTLMSKEGI